MQFGNTVWKDKDFLHGWSQTFELVLCNYLSLYFLVHTYSFVMLVSKLWCIPFLPTIFSHKGFTFPFLRSRETLGKISILTEILCFKASRTTVHFVQGILSLHTKKHCLCWEQTKKSQRNQCCITLTWLSGDLSLCNENKIVW